MDFFKKFLNDSEAPFPNHEFFHSFPMKKGEVILLELDIPI